MSEHVDAGVFDETTERFLARVASAPSAGQYTCDAAGNYVFAHEDDGHIVQFLGTERRWRLGDRTKEDCRPLPGPLRNFRGFP